MEIHDRKPDNPTQRPSALWAGLLLGSLLLLFFSAVGYVVYLFLAWGQTAVAQAPKYPPLALPALVRPVAQAEAPSSPSSFSVWQPEARRPSESVPTLSDRVTILLIGLDARPGEDPRYSRTDSIIVLTLNPKTGSAGMLSLPRDLLVPVPGMTDTVKINSVHVLGELNRHPGGGTALVRTVVSEFLGYPIDYYVRVNFEGVRQVVDLVGGIDVDVPKDILDKEYPTEDYGTEELYIPKGRQHMDGALALKYARTRHGDSDYSRAARQQQVILAVKDKLIQSGQLSALLPRIPGLALAMANHVQTDMPVEKAIALARTINQINLQNPTRVVIDSSYGQVIDHPTWRYSLVPDLTRVRAAAAAVFADAPSGPSPAEAARQALQEEGARIVVLNGTQMPDVAAKTEAALLTEGYTVTAVGNADRADYVHTVLISHGDRTPTTREALVRRFNIPPDRVRSDPSAANVDLTLILGADQVTATTGK